LGLFPWVEYLKVVQFSQLSIGYLIVSSDQRFRRYGILHFCKTAENWTGQHDSLDETKFRRLGKSETPELPNTNPLCNSHCFLMVHYLTPCGLRLTSYDHQNLVGLLNSGKSGQTWPSVINQDSDEISPWPPQKLCIWKTPLTNASSCWLLIQPILTHSLFATDFWIQVKVLNCFGQLGHWNKIPPLWAQNEWNWMRLDYRFRSLLAQLFNAYSNPWFQ
jgi:hypothetical protein